MHNRKSTFRGLKPHQRIGIAIVGLMIIDTGALTLARGQLHYANYWGGAVFAPFAFLIGGLVILMAVKIGPRN